MSKDAYIYKSKMIEGMFFFFLMLIMSIRLYYGFSGPKIAEFIFDKISFLFVPIGVCFFFYRTTQYYHNIFNRIRYRNQKLWRVAFLKETIKASLMVVGLFYLILFVCCFEMSITYVIYMFCLVLLTSQMFVFCSFINLLCSMRGKQWLSYLFCICVNVGFSYLVLGLVPITSFYEDLVGRQAIQFYLFILFFICLNGVMLVLENHDGSIKKISSKGMLLIVCGLVFVLQNIMFKNLYMKESLGFPDVMFITLNEILIPLFLWLFGIVILVFISLYVMLTNYRSHLLFYAIRIQNRTVWFLKTFLKGTIILLIILTCKYGINEWFHNHTMSYLMYMMEGYFRIRFLSLFMFLLYQIYKNAKLFSFGLLAYLILVLYCVATHTGANFILMRVHDVETMLIMAILTLGMPGANCYAINHLDYY